MIKRIIEWLKAEAVRGREMYAERVRYWTAMGEHMFIDEPGCDNLHIRMELEDANNGLKMHQAICRFWGV